MSIPLPFAFDVSFFADNIFSLVLPFVAIQGLFCAFLLIKKASNRL